MSLNKSASRLSLLTGSSVVAAGMMAFAGMAAAPTTAMAQAACVTGASPTPAPTTNATTAVGLPAGTYNPGITCTYTGTGSTVTTAGAITVSTTAGGNGVNLSATGTSVVNWVSSNGTVTAGANTNGPLIDATSASGAINITTAGVTATTAGATGAIRATSTGGGAINISRTTGGIVNNVAGGGAAIEATTNGGNIVIGIAGAGAVQGRLRGILAQTSGAGTIAVNLGAGVNTNAPATEGLSSIAALETVAGTGATTINLTAGTVNLQTGLGPAIRSVSASTSATAAVNVQNTGGVINGRVDFSGVSAGGVTFNNTGATSSFGHWNPAGASVFSSHNDTLTFAGTGPNSASNGASIDFAAGADTLNVSGQLTLNTTTVTFGSGADTLNVSGLLAATGTLLDFGTEADTFSMSGRLAASGLTLNGLEIFNNSGVIYMGGTSGTATDLAADDVLTMASGTYTGSGSARVVMDVMPGVGTQDGCATITVGDCLDLRGASTAGVTLLTLNDVNPTEGLQGGYSPGGITLVDVGGAGTSAAGDFILDPDTTGYIADPLYGGVLSRPGLFVYALRYDPDNQRFVLAGLPRKEVMEYAMLGGAASSIWHMTTDTVTDRQTDLRAGTEGVVWLRTSGEYAKRDVSTQLDNSGGVLAFDNSYKLYAGAVMGGMDLVSGRSGDYDYVVGVQVGYVGSSFDLNASGSSGQMTGATGGLYASAWSSRYFVDAAFNTDFLTLDYDSPALDAKTNTYLNSAGVRVEGGRRFALTDSLFIDPLATFAFVNTSFEEISLTGGEVQPDRAQSLRGALGLRVGGEAPGQSVNLGYFFTGRAWNEFDGEGGGVITNPGDDLAYADDFGGAFTEAEAGLTLYNTANTLSGFMTAGVKSRDGYSAINLSLGLNMRW